ncbi:hypothetical protein MIMGU_mgv1a016562mg [Erythranthe guttata]|uniref:Uncharacterized protein n=1 Tax=Erythranthe guttata TaxID=4155 RepID=A0A022R319_ERYGU|nr:hypothetical protein MIMGU_mgv1a016562mg [Erythranthe guttata]
MIRRKARLIWEIRVQTHVTPQIHHINQKLLPRSLPPVRPRFRNLHWILLRILRKPSVHIHVEFPPLFGEEHGAPATGQLVQIGRVWVYPFEELRRIPLRPLLHYLNQTRRVQRNRG